MQKTNKILSVFLALAIIFTGNLAPIVASAHNNDNWHDNDDNDNHQPSACPAGKIQQTTTVVSDTTNTVFGGGNAVVVSPLGNNWGSISGAQWIWQKNAQDAHNQEYTFVKTYTIPGTSILSANIDVLADNIFSTKFGSTNGPSKDLGNSGAYRNSQLTSENVTSKVTVGSNTLKVTVKNTTDQSSHPKQSVSAAGLIYKLTVVSCVPQPVLGSKTLFVSKNVVGTSTYPASFTLAIASSTSFTFSVPSNGLNIPVKVIAGNYQVTEPTVANFTAAYSAGCSGVAIAGDEPTLCVVTNTYVPPVIVPPTPTSTPTTTPDTFSIKVTKYDCPANTVVAKDGAGRLVDGVPTDVPASCVLKAGVQFGYFNYPNQNNGSSPFAYNETFTVGGVTDANGSVLMPVTKIGRYDVAELNGSGVRVMDPQDDVANPDIENKILGLFCDTDGGKYTDNIDYILTSYITGNQANCVAYDKNDNIIPPTHNDPKGKVTVVKYLNGAKATVGSYPLLFTLSNTNGGVSLSSENNYSWSSEEYLNSSWSISENTNDTNVLPVNSACVAGKTRLVGYSFGTNENSAALAATSSASISWNDLDETRTIIVWNETCPNPAATTVNIEANPSTITVGATSTLSWTSTNANSCTASGSWSGSVATSSTFAVAPTTTATYTIACTGLAGTATSSATVTVSPVVVVPPGGGDGGNNGGGGDNGGQGGGDGDLGDGGSRLGSHRSGGGGGGSSTIGRVLGAETGCGIYLDDYIKLGSKNNVEDVLKLQTFLNEWMGANLPLTGFYGKATYAAVNKFQLQYKEEVLAPWIAVGLHDDINTPTGFVYKTTQRMINNIMCPPLDLPIPDLRGEE